MASVSSSKGGKRRILYKHPADGARKILYLGSMPIRMAEGIRDNVQRIVSARLGGAALDEPTTLWLRDIGDELHAKLAAHGLVASRDGRTLDEWLKAFMESRAELKPESRRKLEQTAGKLRDHFGNDEQLHAITPEAASEWRDELSRSGLSLAAVKTHTGNAKTVFAEAVRLGVITRSPFAHLKGGVTPTKNRRYVTPEETDKVLGACPNRQWRLLVGLARLAGLRTPSETHLLEWGDVDWDSARLRVRSPKTERHPGHEQRTIPIVPKLLRLLQEAFDAAPEGDTRIITLPGSGAHRRRLAKVVERAGVEPWDDCWQTLRRSCEIEWAQRFPQYAVSKWIGHSIHVSGRHYANAIPDELFKRASAEEDADGATRQTTQHQSKSVGNGQNQPSPQNPKDGRNTSDCSELLAVAGEAPNGAGGNRTPVP